MIVSHRGRKIADTYLFHMFDANMASDDYNVTIAHIECVDSSCG